MNETREELAKRLINEMMAEEKELADLRAERDALKAENERLRGYVKHRDACRKSDWDFDEECSCGLDAALREGEK